MNDDVTIRAARPDDVADLVDLWREFMDLHAALPGGLARAPDAHGRWRRHVVDLIADPAWLVIVAQPDGPLAGYLTATVSPYPPIFTVGEYGFVQEIAVAAPWRRRGVGRRLLAAAEEWLFARGVGEIQARVSRHNDLSQGFWSDRGYAPEIEIRVKRRPEGPPQEGTA